MILFSGTALGSATAAPCTTLVSVIAGSVTSETTFQHKLVALEKATPPAGTCDTDKVQRTLNVKMTCKDMPGRGADTQQEDQYGHDHLVGKGSASHDRQVGAEQPEHDPAEVAQVNPRGPPGPLD